MNILVLDWKYIVNSCRYYFYKELSRQADVIHFPFFNMNRSVIPIDMPHSRYVAFPLAYSYRKIMLSGYLRSLRKLIQNENPDIIFFNERFASFVNYKNIGINHIPKAICMIDPRRGDYPKLMDFVDSNNVSLSFYENPAWKTDLPDNIDSAPLTWSVDTRLFNDNGEPKQYDLVSSGVVSKHYPVRYRIRQLLNDPNVNGSYMRYPHFAPMFGKNLNIVKYFKWYAKFLSSGKIFIFYNGIKGRTVAKYVEGLASGSLMMAPYPIGGPLYHLKPGKNFVDINKDNFEEQIEYYLTNEDERLKITQCGIETANKYLNVQDSVANFVKTMENVI